MTKKQAGLLDALESVRRKCVLCGEFVFKDGDTARCDVTICNLHPYRKGTLERGSRATRSTIRAAAVRHCRDCSGSDFRDDCPHAEDCPIYVLACSQD